MLRSALFVAATALLAMTDAAWTASSSPRLRHARLPRAAVFAQEADESMDALISTLRASAPEQIPKVLAENLKAIDQRLFLRLAEMSDAEEDDYEKLRIRQLATLVASSLESILEQADKQMDADAQVVQALLQAMASESGEFELPIPAAQLEALRMAIRERLTTLDEGFVGTVKAYMRKASDDGLDGMVDVLRVLLQTFASERLSSLVGGQLSGAPGEVLTAALNVTPEEWDGVIKSRVSGDSAECTAEDVLGVLQDKMGEVVLGMPAGSAVQTVLAEYLNELMGRARAIAEEE